MHRGLTTSSPRTDVPNLNRQVWPKKFGTPATPATGNRFPFSPKARYSRNSMTRVKQLYAQRLAAGLVTPDPAQAEAVTRLDMLAKQLATSRGWFGGKRPRGLYVWGAVGRGKSMLMDLF